MEKKFLSFILTAFATVLLTVSANAESLGEQSASCSYEISVPVDISNRKTLAYGKCIINGEYLYSTKPFSYLGIVSQEPGNMIMVEESSIFEPTENGLYRCKLPRCKTGNANVIAIILRDWKEPVYKNVSNRCADARIYDANKRGTVSDKNDVVKEIIKFYIQEMK